MKDLKKLSGKKSPVTNLRFNCTQLQDVKNAFKSIHTAQEKYLPIIKCQLSSYKAADFLQFVNTKVSSLLHSAKSQGKVYTALFHHLTQVITRVFPQKISQALIT